MDADSRTDKKRHIVIVGAGFGGLTAAQALKDTDYDITIIDRTNHLLFQPLLYQVATASLSPGDIAMPVRAVFRNQANASVILGEVVAVDKHRRTVTLADGEILTFDYLIMAPGTRHSYFGHAEWEINAPGLKTLADALKIRERILLSLEKADRENDPQKRKKYLNFVIVGGGPTGVELAGAISEIVKRTVIRDYKRVQPTDTSITLIEALPHILSAFDPGLRSEAIKMLNGMGVEVQLDTMVTSVDNHGVETKSGYIESANVIWAAGNEASPVLKSLNVTGGKAGRLPVERDLTLKGFPSIFVIGDAAIFTDDSGSELPALAPVAMQQGRHVAKLLRDHLKEGIRPVFQYKNKGKMATIGRAKGVAEMGRFKFAGFFAWVLWSFVHIFFLIGFRNRFRVMAEWGWYYFTFRGSFRLITGLPRNDSPVPVSPRGKKHPANEKRNP
ncbi:MAG: NAD(P)/FAD-dependent oxidoreductase [Balneolales bacterium]